MGKGRNEKNGCRIVNKQLYFYKSNKQFFLHILSNSQSGLFMVLRILLTKWSSYPDMQLSSQLLGLNENCFFFFFLFSFFFFSFFFFIFFAFSLEAFSNFLHFFISFSTWFLCCSQAFDCNTLRMSNSSSCYSCNMDIPA